jgi:hypothetical protein
MASSIDRNAVSVAGTQEFERAKAAKPGVVKYVISSGQFTTDAAADDTTLYTVPTGRTLFIDSITMGYNTDGSYQVYLHDASGNSVTGTTQFFTASASYWARTLNAANFAVPIPVRKGVTVAGSTMPNSKGFNWRITGWLV